MHEQLKHFRNMISLLTETKTRIQMLNFETAKRVQELYGGFIVEHKDANVMFWYSSRYVPAEIFRDSAGAIEIFGNNKDLNDIRHKIHEQNVYLNRQYIQALEQVVEFISLNNKNSNEELEAILSIAQEGLDYKFLPKNDMATSEVSLQKAMLESTLLKIKNSISQEFFNEEQSHKIAHFCENVLQGVYGDFSENVLEPSTKSL